MRLPNGFGSVYKLQGHRRRPWVVKKTIEGRQKALGYFDTHDAALTFLLKVNQLLSLAFQFVLILLQKRSAARFHHTSF